MTPTSYGRAARVLVPTGPLQLLPRDPGTASTGADDLDLGRSLLQAGPGAYLRVYRPGSTVAFTGRDRLSPGYAAAQAAALEHGFRPVLRAPGGRAVAYHRDCVCVELVLTGSGGLHAVERRFVAFGQVFLDVLAGLGVEARLGEVPGECCPGRHSVVVDGAKLVGTAQRVSAGAFLLGASVVVADPEPVRAVTSAVYDHLGLPFDPATLAAVSDLAPGCTPDAFVAAVRARFAAELAVVESPWPVEQARRAA